MTLTLAESVLALVFSLINSALAKIASGFGKIKHLLKWTLNRFLPTSLHGSPKLQFSTKGHILLEEMTVSYRNSLVEGSVKAQHIEITGISTASLLSLSFDLRDEDDLQFGCSMSIGELTVNCDYSFTGRLAGFRPLQYTGHVAVVLRRVTVEIKLSGHIKVVDGKKFIDLTSMKMTPNIPHLQFEFSEPGCLPSQDDSFRVTLNNVVWQRLYDAVFLHVEQEIGRMVISAMQQFTSTVPFCDIFIVRR